MRSPTDVVGMHWQNKLKYHWDDIYDTETGGIKDAW